MLTKSINEGHTRKLLISLPYSLNLPCVHVPYPLRIADARDEKLQLFFLNLIYLLSCPCSETTRVINRNLFFRLSHLSIRFLNRQQNGWDRQQSFSRETPAKRLVFQKDCLKIEESMATSLKKRIKSIHPERSQPCCFIIHWLILGPCMCWLRLSDDFLA